MCKKDDSLKIAIAQVKSDQTSERMQVNLQKAFEIISNLADEIELIVFPEKFLTGYDLDFVKPNPTKNTFAEDDERITKVRQICAQKRLLRF